MKLHGVSLVSNCEGKAKILSYGNNLYLESRVNIHHPAVIKKESQFYDIALPRSQLIFDYFPSFFRFFFSSPQFLLVNLFFHEQYICITAEISGNKDEIWTFNPAGLWTGNKFKGVILHTFSNFYLFTFTSFLRRPALLLKYFNTLTSTINTVPWKKLKNSEVTCLGMKIKDRCNIFHFIFDEK